MFYHLIAGGTIDEVIYSSLKGKKGIVDEVLRSVKK
jgi:hypothetical protein